MIAKCAVLEVSMKKGLFIYIFIFVLIGCSINENKVNVCCESSECIYVDNDKKMLNIKEAQIMLRNKLGDKFIEGTRISISGVSIYNNRLYYEAQTYEDNDIFRVTTGLYSIDAYTGKVYVARSEGYVEI